jgi:hypothetical protein
MLNTMRHGAVIIDLAAATGGNTPRTMNAETVIHNGVAIVGNSNLPLQCLLMPVNCMERTSEFFEFDPYQGWYYTAQLGRRSGKGCLHHT